MDKLLDILRQIWNLINLPLFENSESGLTFFNIIFSITAFSLLLVFSNTFKKLFVEKLLKRYQLELTAQAALGNVFRLLFIVIGTYIILKTAGIDLSGVGLLAGALGVGIGFGLQNITSNLISGIIILFEKPIKIGDRIDVGGLEGNVTNISFRATTIMTNDNISIIVPNSKFISDQVINWSHNDRTIRFKYPVGVSYKEDPEQVKNVLLEIANNHPGILKDPKPIVMFDSFGDNSLNFILGVWTSDYSNSRGLLKSELYFAIFQKFKEKGIEIPFPQRDIHIITDKTKNPA